MPSDYMSVAASSFCPRLDLHSTSLSSAELALAFDSKYMTYEFHSFNNANAIVCQITLKEYFHARAQDETIIIT